MTGTTPAAPRGFSRQRRLLTKSAYAAVFTNPRRISGDYFRLLVIPSPVEHSRLGLAISRRQAPTAVERNRIKRLVRESFRHRCVSLPPLDIVITLRSSTIGVPAATLRAALDSLWSRLPH